MTERENEFPTIEEIAEEFGEFNPPDSCSPPPELQGPAPRKIAEHLKQGPLERKWRQTAYAALSMAVTLVGLSFLAFVRELGYYILPLSYLDWIGYGIVTLVVFGYVLRKFKTGRYKYVRCGIPLVCRVLRSGSQISEFRGVKTVKFVSLVQFDHPQTNQRTYLQTVSPEIGTASRPDIYSTTVKNGDYVIAVYLPGKLEKSLQIYGYLGLNPDLDFIRKDGRKIEEYISSWKLAGYIGVVLIILALLVGFLYTLEFLFPVEPDWWFFIACTAGALVIGTTTAIIAGCIAKSQKKHTLKIALSGLLVGTILGLLGTMVLLPVINSLFDRSNGQLREIEVTGFWQETYNYIIRNYKIEYRQLGQTKPEKYPATVQHMVHFQQTYFGVSEVKNGALNWPWISHIWPVVPVRPNENGQLEAVSNEQLKQADPSTIDFAIMRGPHNFLPVDDKFRKHIVEKLAGPEK